MHKLGVPPSIELTYSGNHQTPNRWYYNSMQYMYIYIYININFNVYIYISISISMCIYIYQYIYIYTNILIFIEIHIYIYTLMYWYIYIHSTHIDLHLLYLYSHAKYVTTQYFMKLLRGQLSTLVMAMPPASFVLRCDKRRCVHPKNIIIRF